MSKLLINTVEVFLWIGFHHKDIFDAVEHLPTLRKSDTISTRSWLHWNPKEINRCLCCWKCPRRCWSTSIWRLELGNYQDFVYVILYHPRFIHSTNLIKSKKNIILSITNKAIQRIIKPHFYIKVGERTFRPKTNAPLVLHSNKGPITFFGAGARR